MILFLLSLVVRLAIGVYFFWSKYLKNQKTNDTKKEKEKRVLFNTHQASSLDLQEVQTPRWFFYLSD